MNLHYIFRTVEYSCKNELPGIIDPVTSSRYCYEIHPHSLVGYILVHIIRVAHNYNNSTLYHCNKVRIISTMLWLAQLHLFRSSPVYNSYNIIE